MIVFVLGGRGFLGSAFVRACADQHFHVHAIGRDNYDTYRGQQCDILVNANGNAKKFLANTDPRLDFRLSVESAHASLHDFDYHYYIYLSSSDVYPETGSPATTREDIEIDVSAQSPYGFHKLLAETSVRHVVGRKGKGWMILRIGGLVGPGLKKNAVYDVLSGRQPYVHLDSRFQFISTEDVANRALALYAGGVDREIFNIAGVGTITVREMIDQYHPGLTVRPDSEQQKYDINVKKILERTELPETCETVARFATLVRRAAGRNGHYG